MTRSQLSAQLMEQQVSLLTQRDAAWTKALSHADATDMYCRRAALYERDLNAIRAAQGLLKA